MPDSLSDQHRRVSHQLDYIERELRLLDLHLENPPSKQALSSTFPFCYDTLLFHEWIQWVLLPKTRALIAARQSLPSDSNIHAIAEMELAQLPRNTDKLLKALEVLDCYFNQPQQLNS